MRITTTKSNSINPININIESRKEAQALLDVVEISKQHGCLNQRQITVVGQIANFLKKELKK